VIVIRALLRNQKPFWYANFIKKVEIIDDDGSRTAQFIPVYDNPVKCFGNISGARGETEIQAFGVNAEYDRVIALVKSDISEESVLWVDIAPELEVDGSLIKLSNGQTKTPFNHIVKRISRSLNSELIAISRVSAS